MMNIDQLRMELEYDEGCKFEIYYDHLGLPTLGIGHLITKDDPEYELEVGTAVSAERVKEAFESDVDITIQECKKLYDEWIDYPDEVQLILANMMYNLGRPRLSQFKLMKAALDERNWSEASLQMADSKWYNQVPNRAGRLCKRMAQLV